MTNLARTLRELKERNGLPHESVTKMEILTGDGRVVAAAQGPGGEHAELFRGFPNSRRPARY